MALPNTSHYPLSPPLPYAVSQLSSDAKSNVEGTLGYNTPLSDPAFTPNTFTERTHSIGSIYLSPISLEQGPHAMKWETVRLAESIGKEDANRAYFKILDSLADITPADINGYILYGHCCARLIPTGGTDAEESHKFLKHALMKLTSLSGEEKRKNCILLKDALKILKSTDNISHELMQDILASKQECEELLAELEEKDLEQLKKKIHIIADTEGVKSVWHNVKFMSHLQMIARAHFYIAMANKISQSDYLANATTDLEKVKKKALKEGTSPAYKVLVLNQVNQIQKLIKR